MIPKILRSSAYTLLGMSAAFLLARTADTRRSARTARAGSKSKVVVVGAGFAGLSAASQLAGRDGVDLMVIDMHDHHLFQPLLYQVATAALSPSDIASPIRGILPEQPGVRVLMAAVTGVDIVGRRVVCDTLSVPYDELVIATGSRPSYFGHGSWAKAAPGLKTLDDAVRLRRSMLEAFEHATVVQGRDRDRALTFVLIGGGPTGVEMAGSIAELAQDLTREQAGQTVAKAKARIVLVEAGPRILSSFAPELSDYARSALQAMGIEVREGTKVTGIEPGVVHLGQDHLAADTVIWTAGTEATPVAKWLGVARAHGGRVAVTADLRVPHHPEIAVIGDAALVHGSDGKPLPGLAPVAKQQGRFVGRAILRRVRGRHAQRQHFSYRDYGTLATIGRNKAVAELGPVRFKGFVAWFLWVVVHIFFLISFRHRVLVMAKWGFSYVRNEHPEQLIIGLSPDKEKTGT